MTRRNILWSRRNRRKLGGEQKREYWGRRKRKRRVDCKKCAATITASLSSV